VFVAGIILNIVHVVLLGSSASIATVVTATWKRHSSAEKSVLAPCCLHQHPVEIDLDIDDIKDGLGLVLQPLFIRKGAHTAGACGASFRHARVCAVV
jgi:hypothetical protein